ncbi:glycoside hydrolase family 3 protein [Anaerocolumna jejuensis]|uniref:glycoside hydrolase family 3 protein n=1 Tax=Anaerocolumna jejuensis TaxID=259063 RepID=UPI003F7C7D44
MLDAIISPPSEWVKRTMENMSIDEKLGQLMVSRVFIPNIEESISAGIIGNIYVTNDTTPERIRELQKLAKIPMLISADLESGYLYNKNSWPAAISLGAIGDVEIAYKWAYYQALEARENGINSVYGPVLDIAMNQDSIATGSRALSGNVNEVAQLAIAVIKGYQNGGILPFAKHFPGFGRGKEDAHMELSSCDVQKEILLKEDILPYIEAVKKAGLSGIMTGHIMVKDIDDTTPLPLSKKIFSILDEIGFQGLTITDSLAMKGIALEYSPDILYPGSLAAGHDLILVNYSIDDREGHNFLKKGLADGIITQELLDRKVERVLKAKENLMRFLPPHCDLEQHRTFFQKIADDSVTFIKNDEQSQSFTTLNRDDNILFAIVMECDSSVQGEIIVEKAESSYLKEAILKEFPNASIKLLEAYPNPQIIEEFLYTSREYKEICMITVTSQRAYAGTANISMPVKSLISALKKKIHTLVTVGNPYAIKDLETKNLNQVVVTYGGGLWIDSVIRVLSGGKLPTGKLPVTIL